MYCIISFIYTFIFDIVNNKISDEDNSIEPEIDENGEYEEFEENDNEDINKND